MTDAVSALGSENFVSLTTFKKDGTAVAAPMWIGRDEDHLFFWTPSDSWKVKRVNNNAAVLLAPCSRRGKIRDGADSVRGTAQVIADPTTVARLTGLIRRKYGFEFVIVTFIERLLARKAKPRAILRITLAG